VKSSNLTVAFYLYDCFNKLLKYYFTGMLSSDCAVDVVWGDPVFSVKTIVR